MRSRPRISLVIPARNEEALLPSVLESVREAKGRYPGPPESIEVIVADNASTDATRDIARERGFRVVSIATRRIGAVRNAGAGVARGEILAFVDADTRIHRDTFRSIEDVLRDDCVVGGATGFSMDRWSPGIAATYVVMGLFVALSRLDSGVVFCRRRDFESMAGFREDLLFGEDVRFLLDLRDLGRSRGQRFVRLRGVKATTSTRKFDAYGDWHYLRNLIRSGYWWLRDREALDRWAREYWYG